MPISGLAITLSGDPVAGREALEAMRTHEALMPGELIGSRLPVVVETPDSEQDREVWDWLHALPGVVHVDVVYVHFDEASGVPDRTPAETGSDIEQETPG